MTDKICLIAGVGYGLMELSVSIIGVDKRIKVQLGRCPANQSKKVSIETIPMPKPDTICLRSVNPDGQKQFYLDYAEEEARPVFEQRHSGPIDIDPRREMPSRV